jgi:hypothetical protein
MGAVSRKYDAAVPKSRQVPAALTWSHSTLKTALWARLFLLILSLFTSNFGALCE